ncbi:hypothetical protein ANCDUO_26766, partial [Ancylostoma duodenale]
DPVIYDTCEDDFLSRKFHSLQRNEDGLTVPNVPPNYIHEQIEGRCAEIFFNAIPNIAGCEVGAAAVNAELSQASRMGPLNAPPPYTPCFPCVYYYAPAACYMPPTGNLNGFQAPTHLFPEKPQGH